MSECSGVTRCFDENGSDVIVIGHQSSTHLVSVRDMCGIQFDYYK